MWKICDVMIGVTSLSVCLLICTQKFCRVHLRWSREWSHQCCSAMHNIHAVLTPTRAVWNNGHIRVIDATLIKSSKLGTMLPHNRHAKSHVIIVTISTVHWEARE